MSIASGIFGSLGVARLLYFSVAMTGGPSPASWSPDGRWICYAAAEPREAAPAPKNWFFESGDLGAAPTGKGLKSSTSPRPEEARVFRIWATQAGPPQASVLLEESDGPVGSPAWRPDGRGIAFVRFVPKERVGVRIRGRFEVVVKEGMNRRKVLHAEDDLEADEPGLAELCASTPAWNRDGSSLAVTRPGGASAVLILDPGTGKLRRTVDNASQAVWSPDGSRLIVARTTAGQSGPDALVVVDTPSATSPTRVRPVLTETEILQPPIWAADGQSILVVYRKSRVSHGNRLLSREIMLGRVSTVTGQTQQEWPLGSDRSANRDRFPRNASPRIAPPPGPNPHAPGLLRLPLVLGAHLDLDPETEDCFYTTDHNGQASIVVLQNLRTDITHKRFVPLDLSIGVGALAASPDGRTLAIRFCTDSNSSRLTTPALCDVATGALTIPIADESIRVDWLSRLIETTQTLVRTAVPASAVHGLGIVQRPILLPVPGELTAGDELDIRIRRLGRIGRAVCEVAPLSVGGSAPNRDLMAQAALYFDYLAGNPDAAEAALNDLETTALTPRRREDLLGVRAQILMAKGDLSGSLAIIDYMIDRESARVRTLEETPAGMVIEDVPNPRRVWGKYLAHRHTELKHAQAEQQRGSQSHETGPSPEQSMELIEDVNRELPVNIPFDPAAGLFIGPR
jgi:hypothetical protein